MTKSLTTKQRAEWLSWLEQDPVNWAELHFAIEDRIDPITGEELGPGPIILADHQKRIIRAALERDAGGRFRWTTIVYSAVKKSGKSRVTALVACWVAAKFGPYAEVYCCANDGKQSEDRILSAVKKCLAINSHLGWRETRSQVTLPDGSFIEAIPVDPTGEAGSNPTMSAWSELWGYGLQHKQRLWAEMAPSPARMGRSIQWVDTYAGYEGESPVLEQLYDQGVTQGRRYTEKFPDLPVYINEPASLFMYWDHEARMVWQTPAYYAAEESRLPPHQFQRIHRNMWVSSTDTFVPIQWWTACQEKLPPLQDGEKLILGADAAVSGACFGLVGVTRHPGRREDVAVRYARAWKPPKGGKIDFTAKDGPEAEIRRLCEQYKVIELAYDPYQLHRTATELNQKRIVYARPFGQMGQRLEGDSQLYQLIRDRRIAHSGEPELMQHIMNANSKTAKTEDTKMRIVQRTRNKPIDLCVALAMAAARALYVRL